MSSLGGLQPYAPLRRVPGRSARRRIPAGACEWVTAATRYATRWRQRFGHGEALEEGAERQRPICIGTAAQIGLCREVGGRCCGRDEEAEEGVKVKGSN